MGVIMPGEFKNPFKNLSKPQVYAAIAGTVLVAGIAEYMHHQKTGSWNLFSSNQSSSGAIDPVTNMPYSQDQQIDPVTNLPYLAEAQQYGSVAAAEAAVSAYGQTSPTGSGIGVQPVSGGDGGTTGAPGSVGSPTYTTNEAWSQAATAGLADIGFSETAVATALGDFLNDRPESPDEARLTNTALAEYGRPPVGNHQIILAPNPKPANTVKVPQHLIGSTQQEAYAVLEAAGLKGTGATEVKGKTLIVQSVTPSEGTAVAPGSTVHLNSKVK